MSVLSSFSRKDQEEQGQCKVQGALQQVPVHAGHHRQGEGREAEAVPAPRSVTAVSFGERKMTDAQRSARMQPCSELKGDLHVCWFYLKISRTSREFVAV